MSFTSRGVASASSQSVIGGAGSWCGALGRRSREGSGEREAGALRPERPACPARRTWSYRYDTRTGPMAKRRRTLPAAEFEARCLAILDEVDATGEEVTITKHGR